MTICMGSNPFREAIKYIIYIIAQFLSAVNSANMNGGRILLTYKWISGEDGIENCRALRREVFVKEQGVSLAEEEDGRDVQAVHLALYLNGEIAATARLFPEIWLVGRVAVVKRERGTGIGRNLMEEVFRYAFSHGASCVHVHAQRQAVPFYEALGFVPAGEPFSEAGIEHLPMRKDLK